MKKILVTENKSIGSLSNTDYSVRVFVDHDMTYGYWVSEHTLFELLSAEQQKEYLRGADASFYVDTEVANKIIEIGHTPYAKRTLK